MVDPAKAKHASPSTVKSSRGFSYIRLEDIVTTDALFRAYKRSSKGKRGRYGCYRFGESLGARIEELKTSILDGTYHPKPCFNFDIWCTAGQKVRRITAPTFSDGVVQHVFYDNLYEVFDRGFIFDSYGCRRGKGTHKAADRVQRFMRMHGDDEYYLQIDIRKYYYSIDHKILRQSLERSLNDERIVNYIMEFAGDAEKGLQVGCLLSQLFGMIYLDRFDHYCKRILKVKHYVRYVDDIVMIGLTRSEAVELKDKCERFLAAELGLRLSKWKIQKIKTGINFVGFRTWKSHRLVRKRSMLNFNRALKKKKFVSVCSIMAHAKLSSSFCSMKRKLEGAICEEDLPNLNRFLSRVIGLPKQAYQKASWHRRHPFGPHRKARQHGLHEWMSVQKPEI